MIRLLLDEGLPVRAASVLCTLGLDTVHARDVGLASCSDEVVIEFARQNDRACITLDLDFHRILATTSATSPSVVLVRVQSLDYLAMAKLIFRIVKQIESDLHHGVAATATDRALRLRHLPLK